MRIAAPTYLPHEITHEQYINAFCAQYPQWADYVRGVCHPGLIPGTESELVLCDRQDNEEFIRYETRTSLIFRRIMLPGK